jgi:hypothetical protein
MKYNRLNYLRKREEMSTARELKMRDWQCNIFNTTTRDE